MKIFLVVVDDIIEEYIRTKELLSHRFKIYKACAPIQEYSMGWIEVADAILFDKKCSVKTHEKVANEAAKYGIPIFYDVDDLVEWRKTEFDNYDEVKAKHNLGTS